MKKIIKSSLLVYSLCLISAGCLLNSSELNQVAIRIQNNSSYDMNNIKVVFPEEEVSYGDVPSGESSTFNEVEKAYRYAYIETIVNEKKLVLQPVDYVGESLLEPGLYTYQLQIAEETFNSENYSGALLLQFIRDSE